MKKVAFTIFIIILVFNTDLKSQINYQRFHKKIMSTYKKTVSSESELDLLNKAIENKKK